MGKPTIRLTIFQYTGKGIRVYLLDVQSFRTADCDTDYYLVVVKRRERLAANKQRFHRLHMERYNLRKLNEIEGKKKYHVDVSNRFAA
jgi:hypothetical protein